MSGKTLVAMDFDHTIINDNSDTYIQRLAVNGQVPKSIKRTYNSKSWILYMNCVFQHLHSLGTTPQQILDCVAQVEWTPGMKDLLASLDRRRYELIIVSDSNSVFIGRVLAAAGLDHVFASVLTNPASFDERGLLVVRPYHQQNWCELSTENLCKGHILETYVAERRRAGTVFERIAYVGDGQNDYCPSLRLSEGDLVFARHSMTLHNMLESSANSERDQPKAAVHIWKTGFDILAVLQQESP